MTIISKNAFVLYNAQQMYELVDDIEAYPHFLPWCKSTQVLARDEDGVKAKIDISHAGMSKTFTTRNRNQKNKMIEMRLVEGPFKRFEGFWRFDEVDGKKGCNISFDLEFEFSNRLIGLALGPAFNQIANSLVEAFTHRAMEKYG